MNVTVSYAKGTTFRWRPKSTIQSWPISKPPHQVWYREIHWGFLVLQLDNEETV